MNQWIALVLVVLIATSGNAQELDDLFRQNKDEPGCVVGYARDGEVEYLKGFGSANLEHSIPITPQTRFHVASVSKQFTGVAIGLLILEGKLSLADDVRRHLPEFPDYGHPITIDHLLQHRSGLQNHSKLMRPDDLLDYGNSTSQQEALNLVFEQKLNFRPGEKFEYSSGYLVLAKIVENVSGLPFRVFAEQRLFKPLGMKHSGIHDDFSIIPNRAEGYLRDGDRWINDRVRYTLVGSGGVHSTAGDLLIWSHALRHDKLAPGLSKLLFESPAEARTEDTSYHFGLTRAEYRNQPTFGHSGSFQASRTTLYNFEPGMTTIIACNHRIDTEQLTWKLLAKIAPPNRDK